MQYVTEDELRYAYEQAPFSAYELPDGSRLTPSARQFLIDFHISFEAQPPTRTLGATANTAKQQGQTHREFLDDIAVIGAQLRLTGCHALGIDNNVAEACDACGTAWLTLSDEHPLTPTLDVTSRTEASDKDACVVLPYERTIHPVYFEVAVRLAELNRCLHLWAATSPEVVGTQTAPSDDVRTWWTQDAQTLRTCLVQTLRRVKEGVSHE